MRVVLSLTPFLPTPYLGLEGAAFSARVHFVSFLFSGGLVLSQNKLLSLVLSWMEPRPGAALFLFDHLTPEAQTFLHPLCFHLPSVPNVFGVCIIRFFHLAWCLRVVASFLNVVFLS